MTIYRFIPFSFKPAGWLFFLLSSICCTKTDLSLLQIEMDSISSHWAPDPREGICSVSLAAYGKNKLLLRGETLFPQAKDEMLSLLQGLGYVCTDSVDVLPAKDLGNKTWGWVTISMASMRKQPAHESELVSQAILGTPVRLLKYDSNGWYCIQTPDRYLGWVDASSLAEGTEDDLHSWLKSPRVVWMELQGQIYSMPGLRGESIGDLVAGAILKKTSNGSFTGIQMPDGREGFIPTEKCATIDDWLGSWSASGEQVCATATRFMGLPYLWGGTSSKAIDCSGFVKTVYQHHGILLARDASLQALQGETVNAKSGTNELKPGDLLFFGEDRNGKTPISHVALYLGNDEYIHAAGRVMVNSLDSTRGHFNRYRYQTLQYAKRMLSGDSIPFRFAFQNHPWYKP